MGNFKYDVESFGGKFNYLISRPEGFEAGKKYPVILFLHGAGTRGTDISILEKNSSWNNINEMSRGRFIVVAPHCSRVDWNEYMPDLFAFCEWVRTLPEVDTDRFYLTGNSMGGYGTWELSILHPEFFAAVMPVCGGGMAWNAGRLIDVPVWAFHGLLDPTVAPEESMRMVNGVNSKGGHAKLTVYETLKHNCWTTCYVMPEVYEWFLSNKKSSSNVAEELHGEIYG